MPESECIAHTEDGEWSDSDMEPAKLVLNDAESLRRGIVKTTKNKKEFTILLVGETGTGKTSFLSLLYNVLVGNPLRQYVEKQDTENEAGGSQAESQTQSALIYEFTSKNGIQFRILDTPGLADTRGLVQDELHKQSIAETIRDHIDAVHGVLILANGTVPRLGVATDYALTTLMSIFPRTLAQNITILFTNVTDVMNVNFEHETLPSSISRDHLLYLNNPLAMQKSLEKMRKQKKLTSQQLQKSHRSIQEAEGAALDTLVEMFDWLDGLEPQPTLDFISLYEKTQSIDQGIANALARMNASTIKQQSLLELEGDIDQAKETMRLYENFEAAVTRKMFRLDSTQYLNRICNDCHSNCSLGRGGFFGEFHILFDQFNWTTQISAQTPSEITRLCSVCQHNLSDHSRVRAVWAEVEQTSNTVDEEARERFTHASSERERKESMRSLVQKALEEIQRRLEEDTRELGQIAQEYAKLALSGSFAGHLHKSVKLLSTKLESMRNDGTSAEIIARMEKSLERLNDKLRVLENAQSGVRGRHSVGE